VTLAPLLDVLVSSAVISYLTYPLYERFLKLFKNTGLAAGFTIMVFALPFLLAFLYLAYFIISQGQAMAEMFLGGQIDVDALLGAEGDGSFGTSIAQFVPHLSSLESGSLLLVKLTVFFIAMFYFTTEYQAIRTWFANLMKEEEGAQGVSVFLTSVDNALKGMVYGYVLTSFIVILISSIAYAIVGISNAVLLGFITGIMGLLPILGAWMVYVPVGAYQIYLGNPIEGVGIIVFGILFINIIQEFYIRPRLSENVAHIHPIYTIVGFIAGPLKFGLFGLILGPLALGLLKGVFDGFLEYKEIVDEKKDAS
jgi:predicted PurR-regulated permease PerM